MEALFTPTPPFQAFSFEHWMTLLFFAVLGVGLILFAQKKTTVVQEQIGLLLGIVIAIASLLWPSYYLAEGTFSLSKDLPLDMCYISAIFAPILMMNRNANLYQILYYWILVGTLQACITPNVAEQFPHIWYLRFFIIHCGLVIAIFYATFVYGHRPTLKGLWLSYLSLLIFACCLFAINSALDSNYMFTHRKPDNPSLIDLLGPHPWYLLVVAGMCLVLFFVVYLPFWKKSKN
jgi:hypothetical integral membrane protein (TIGR02206 family)